MEKTILNPQVQSIDKDNLALKFLRLEPVEVVNVSSPDDYHLGLIKRSKRIPLDELESRIKELDKNKEVITYDSGYEHAASLKAAELLSSRGFRVRFYEGGIDEWKGSSLPLE